MNPTAHDDLVRLRAALDYPENPPVPDVAAIIARGRRAQARRRVTASVAAVVVVAAAVVILVPRGASGPPIPAPDPALLAALHGGPAPAVLVADGTHLAEAPTSFDPLTRTLDVGWVPDGLNGAGASTAPYEQSYGAADDAYVNGGPDIGLSITVLSRGRSIGEFSDGALGLPRDAVARPTDPINGGTAVCLSDPYVAAGTCSALRWEYAPGAWARVSYAGSAGPTPQTAAAVARRVAESVSLSAGGPVRLPFTLSGRLAGLQPLSTWVRISDTADAIDHTLWTADVDLAQDADADEPEVMVRCSWRPGGGAVGAAQVGYTRTTVDGHQANLAKDGTDVVVGEVRTTKVRITGGDAVSEFADVTVVDDPVDPAGWPASR